MTPYGRTFRILSLGCAKNLVDSEHIAGSLVGNGWIRVHGSKHCDLLVVNTCAFIEDAQRESIEALGEALETKGEDGYPVVVAAGCLVQDAGNLLRRVFPGIDMLIGTHEIPRFSDHLKRVVGEGTGIRLYRRGSDSGSAPVTYPREPLESRFSRYVKIADGCDTGCAFCVIPRIRGPQKSLPHELVIRECEHLYEQGAREIILVSQDTTAYGIDRGEKDALAHVLMLLSQRFASVGELWIRLLYLNPHRISTAMLHAMAQPPILPYFDLALQHASSRVLRAMSRPVTAGGNEALIARIRNRIPHAVLRATVMIGHPGEDTGAFNTLLSFLEKARLDHVGVFTYSPQRGTRSADRESPPKSEVEMRLVEINALLSEISEYRFEKQRGNTYRFIRDDHVSKREGSPHARSWMDAPDIDRIYKSDAKAVSRSSPFFWGTISGGDMILPAVSIAH